MASTRLARILVLIASTALSSSALAAEPFLPTEQDLELIRSGLSEKMLDPSSTIVSDVVAAKENVDGQTINWVCGKVRGKNTFGGYAQPTNFMGTILETAGSGRMFVVINIAGPSNEEQLRTLRTCLDKLR